MYSLQINIHQILDLWHVSGAVWETSDEGERLVVATFSEDQVLGDSWLDEDGIATMLHVLRQWSIRAILE